MLRNARVGLIGWAIACEPDVSTVKSEPNAIPTEPVTSETGYHSYEDEGYVPTLPTDITEACWSWGVQTEADHGWTVGEYLTFNDPVTLARTHYRADLEPDGVAEFTWDKAFEANGVDLTSYRYDGDGDGDFDELQEYTYDGMGLRTGFSWDRDGDGAFDEVHTYEYVEGLRVAGFVDEGDDGTTDRWERYTYDEADRVVRHEIDEGGDGGIEALYLWEYVDGTGPDHTYTADLDADGVPEETRLRRYDADGRLSFYSAQTETWNLDEATITYAFPAPSEDRATIERRLEPVGEAPYDYQWEYTYEAPGKVATELVRYVPEEGDPYVESTDWTWTCP
jgi:hypothetical protein